MTKGVGHGSASVGWLSEDGSSDSTLDVKLCWLMFCFCPQMRISCFLLMLRHLHSCHMVHSFNRFDQLLIPFTLGVIVL